MNNCHCAKEVTTTSRTNAGNVHCTSVLCWNKLPQQRHKMLHLYTLRGIQTVHCNSTQWDRLTYWQHMRTLSVLLEKTKPFKSYAHSLLTSNRKPRVHELTQSPFTTHQDLKKLFKVIWMTWQIFWCIHQGRHAAVKAHFSWSWNTIGYIITTGRYANNK